MVNNDQEIIKLIEQTHNNLKEIVKSENLSVRDLAFQMLALSKFCIANIDPDKFEHINDFNKADR